MIQVEAKRLAYLDAMGVDVYLPRVVLPGACPSVHIGEPAFFSSELAPSPLSEAPHQPEAKPQPAGNASLKLAALQEELSAGDSAGRARTTEKSVEKHTVAENGQPVEAPVSDIGPSVRPVNLALFQPVPGMMLVTSAAGMDNRHLRLLKNILRALNHRVDMLVPMDNFTWPPKNISAAIPVDQQAASETLCSLLEGYQKKLQLKVLLVFGSDPAELIAPTGGNIAEGELFQNFELAGMQSIVLPGIEEMLTKARFKQQAWQQLQALV